MRNKPITILTPEEDKVARSMVIARDDAIIAFNKPPGLACQTRSTADHTLDRLLWAFAKSNGKRPHLVHRLDRETSGVIVAAHTKPAAAALHGAFEARCVQKTYLALVQRPTNDCACDEGTITQPLATVRDGTGTRTAAVEPGTEGAKPAKTHWKCLGQSQQAALLSIRPTTGRMHQIRVHLALADMPILGDRQYGLGAADDTAWTDPIPRTMLHAFSLRFPHPSGTQSTVKADPPQDFRDVAQAMELANSLERVLVDAAEAR
ncbi:MAG: RluA family pseudouridine synthase [Pseudomonadota bacterium]